MSQKISALVAKQFSKDVVSHCLDTMLATPEVPTTAAEREALVKPLIDYLDGYFLVVRFRLNKSFYPLLDIRLSFVFLLREIFALMISFCQEYFL